MQKGFTPLILLVGILVIIGIAGGAYFFGKAQVAKPQLPNPVVISQTPQPSSVPDETANWKTYTSTKYGFELKYPQNLIVEETSDVINFKMVGNKDDKTGFLIIVYKNPSNLSLKDYETKNASKGEFGPNVYYSDSQLVTFENGIKAYYQKKEISCFLKCGSYVIVNKDKIYKFQGYGITDQILSTFKFLDQTQDGESGIVGKIVLGPSCPVVEAGSENECQDKSYQGTVSVRTRDGTKEITKFTSDTEGNFKVSLAPGNYLLVSDSGGRPFAKPQSVTVEKNQFTAVTVSFDTGIR